MMWRLVSMRCCGIVVLVDECVIVCSYDVAKFNDMLIHLDHERKRMSLLVVGVETSVSQKLHHLHFVLSYCGLKISELDHVFK